jgi:hypothetical protein
MIQRAAKGKRHLVNKLPAAAGTGCAAGDGGAPAGSVFESVAVAAPSEAAAYELGRRVAAEAPVEVEPEEGGWTVTWRWMSMPEWPDEVHEALARAINLVQRWVDELDAAVDVTLGGRAFTLRPR